MNQWRQNRTSIVSGVALLGVIAAVYFSIGSCDGPAQPASLPPIASPTSSGASSTSSPSPATAKHAPRMATTAAALPPSKLPKNLTAGQLSAVNSVVAYTGELTRAMNTGDTAALKSFTSPDCPCRADIRFIEDHWKNGSIKAPDFSRIKSVYKVETVPSGPHTTVHALVSYSARTYLDTTGKILSRDAAIRLYNTYTLRQIDAKWFITSVQVVPAG